MLAGGMWGGAGSALAAGLTVAGAHSGGPTSEFLLFVESWVSWLLEQKGGEGRLLLSNTMLLKAGMSQSPITPCRPFSPSRAQRDPPHPHPTPRGVGRGLQQEEG